MSKPLTERNQTEQAGLLEISLVCSVLALGSWHLTSQNSTQASIMLKTLKVHPLNFLFFSLVTVDSNTALQELIKELLQTLNTTFDIAEAKLKIVGVKNERLKQYLRKFNFFYRYYYLSVYPNDLSATSLKKTNTLAIKSLFLIHSILLFLINIVLKIYKILGFFGGFLVSSIIDTTLGELNEWAIVGAALVVASLETASKFFYTLVSRVRNGVVRRSYLLNLMIILNTIKVGIIYGLIVDAFKLGS